MTTTPTPTPLALAGTHPPADAVHSRRRFRISDQSGRSDVVWGTRYRIDTEDGCERLVILDHGDDVVAEYSSSGWASIMPLPDRGGDGAR